MSTSTQTTLEDWIAREAIPFDLDSTDSFNAAVDRVVKSAGESVDVLGFGEAMHGAEQFLVLRNRLFQRLVEAHGYTATAIESSFPRGHITNEYVNWRGPASFDAIVHVGFSHGFGKLEANRQLIEWMRQYNARGGTDSSHPLKLRFYGFDSPTEMMGTDSPRQLLRFALDYLASIDAAAAEDRRRRIENHLGSDADWENPAAMMDPSKSLGLSPAAAALRIETEDLIAELQRRRPELIAGSGADRFLEALQHATVGRQMLNYHAGLAGTSPTRIADLLGIRDIIIADNLAYMADRERRRGGGRGGKVLAFGHNSHLKRGQAKWQLGPHALAWWPGGAHLAEILGPRYAVIGTGVGISDANGIAQPQPGTLESRLTRAPGPARFIPTHTGRGLATSEIAALPTRAASMQNQTYFPLTPQSFTDFDWLLVLNSL